MKPQNKIIASMIAIYFYGKVHTREELRTAISSLAATSLFEDVSNDDIEEIARTHENLCGIHRNVKERANPLFNNITILENIIYLCVCQPQQFI